MLAVAAGILYLRYVPGTLPGGAAERPLQAGNLRSRLGDVLRTPGIAATLASQLAYLWMFSAVFGTLLALFGRDELGMSPSAIGVVFAIGLGSSWSSSTRRAPPPTGGDASSCSFRRSPGRRS